jgi:hypothetical protein
MACEELKPMKNWMNCLPFVFKGLKLASIYHSILTNRCASARNLLFLSTAVKLGIFKVNHRKHCRHFLLIFAAV